MGMLDIQPGNIGQVKLQLVTPFANVMQFQYWSPRQYYLKFASQDSPDFYLMEVNSPAILMQMIDINAYRSLRYSLGDGDGCREYAKFELYNLATMVQIASIRKKAVYKTVMQTMLDNWQILVENPTMCLANPDISIRKQNPIAMMVKSYIDSDENNYLFPSNISSTEAYKDFDLAAGLDGTGIRFSPIGRINLGMSCNQFILNKWSDMPDSY